MLQSFLGIYFPIIFLLIISFLFVIRDRIFLKRTRMDFYALFLISVLLLLGDSVSKNSIIYIFNNDNSYALLRCLFYPCILLIWFDVLLRDKLDTNYSWLRYPLVVNVILVLCSYVYAAINPGESNLFLTLSFIVSSIFNVYLIVAMMLVAKKRAKRDQTSEDKVLGLMLVGLVISLFTERLNETVHTMDMVIIICVCLYFFYLEIQIYKRDALTKLMTRHNLMYELENRVQEHFWVSLVDVDNFKKINDKYGHEKGDEALKIVVEALKNNFSDTSKIYRYGGDEFVILSSGLTKEQLVKLFDKVNSDLSSCDKRISYGFIVHNPGEDHLELLKKADDYMYENKRKAKTEDIWDPMTGTLNLKGFVEELEFMKKHAYLEGEKVIIGVYDVARLGSINTEYGYTEGNFIIKTVADIIEHSLDNNSTMGHIGGDQFIVAIHTHLDNQEEMDDLTQRIHAGILHTSRFQNKEYTVDINSINDFMNLAGQTAEHEVNRIISMSLADKENMRKNAYSNDSYGNQNEIDKEEEEFALDIISNNKYKYALQPIVSAKDGEIVAYEALMRSNTEPIMSPLTLLRHAYKNNRSYDIEKSTFFNVMELFKSIKDSLGEKRVFLNSIPGHLLTDEDYAKLRKEYGNLLKDVVVEITEQSELTDEELDIIRKRQEEDGNGIAIDDYGSGASNTYNLLRIRPEVIKLDRLLISDIDRNTKKQYFVNSIVTFAKENGMRVLAEGVETEAEMKMVIRLHVDYLQGYYLARPAYEPLEAIDESIKKAIISENIKGVVDGKRKIYLANNENYMSLVQVALEEYTGITISSPKLTLVGSRDYEADMCLKIKDGTDCYLILKDVRLTSVDQLPCIDLGEDVHLTIVLEGECALTHRGIHVPFGSSVDFIGSGSLTVSAKGHDCYGIGAGSDEEVGEIRFNQSGNISVRVDGEESIAIGGGIYKDGSGISIESGMFDVSIASVTGIGIGCKNGDIPIDIRDTRIGIEVRVNDGIGIGSLNGAQKINLSGFDLKISGSGSRIAGVGSINESHGFINMSEGTLEIGMSGQELYLAGVPKGEIESEFRNLKLSVKGEGNNVLAFGSGDYSSRMDVSETTAEIVINSAVPIAFGVKDENLSYSGAKPVLHINE